MIYERIKELRKETGLSQEKVAQELSMYVTTYRRYESGERELPMEVAVRIADYYGVSLDYLAGRSNDRTIKE
ncbi:helix-turn-helix transcriptional regulator [uncultured Negativibacillus sp.]|uniref:helix-turn-helix domain-containing protein n=1 Tax=uncultured Negativibacillus sp. TaxID=1980696 RepID=UPI0025F8C222|nr:helix-turn-helix transcriptional regulator [uncultured Negativibacillus sp.]